MDFADFFSGAPQVPTGYCGAVSPPDPEIPSARRPPQRSDPEADVGEVEDGLY